MRCSAGVTSGSFSDFSCWFSPGGLNAPKTASGGALRSQNSWQGCKRLHSLGGNLGISVNTPGWDGAVTSCSWQWDSGTELQQGDKVWRHPWISHKAADCGTRPQRLLSLFLRCLSLPNYVSERFPFDANRPGKALENKPEKDTPARTACPQLGVMPLLMGWGCSSASPSTSVQLCLELLGSTPSPMLWDNL